MGKHINMVMPAGGNGQYIYIYVDSIDHPGSAAAPYLSWDAHNKESKALAEKLGYRFDREYTSYEIAGY